MHAEFWETRWQNREIGFHYDNVNPLQKHFNQVDVPVNGSIFILPCGKTGDMTWLHEQGFGHWGRTVPTSDPGILKRRSETARNPIWCVYWYSSQYAPAAG